MTGKSQALNRAWEDTMKPAPAYAAFPLSSSGSRHRPGLPCAETKPRHGAAGSSQWSTYWRDFGEGDQQPERCHIPGDGGQVVDQHWARFAERLPLGAQVIDIGCGAGTVGRTLLRQRSDLFVTGVDFAEVPIDAFPHLTIHPWVSMEALPFGDSAFDAAVSLFGIEYGAIAQTARELAQVLKRGGRFSFVIHHCESEIAREGTTRVRGIRDVLSGKMKAAFLAGDGVRLDQQRLRLRSDYPGEPTVKLISDHFRRNIERTRAERLAIWQKLIDDVETEVALTAQMTRSAKSAAQMGSWLVPLLASMSALEVTVLRRESGEPIGWAVSGER
jgi:SAM-dependent methyltransferase